MAKSNTEAMGGGARRPSRMARMKSRPDMARPASAVGSGSNQEMTRERGSPHAAGGDAGGGGGTAAPPGTSGLERIVSCNSAYRMSPMTQLTPDLNDPALGSSGIALGTESRLPEKGGGIAGGG